MHLILFLFHLFIFVENEVIINADLDGLNSSNSSRPDSVKIIFHLGKDYPLQFPQISVFSENLDREAVSKVKNKVLQTCTDLLGEPMLISLISAVRENVQLELESKHSSIVPSNNSQSACNDSCSSSDEIWTTVLHIDHMRSKNKYCKTLEKWASDLDLCGRILFCNKLILVLLQREVENIKVWLKEYFLFKLFSEAIEYVHSSDELFIKEWT